MAPEVQLGPTRYILIGIAVINVVMVYWIDWPASADHLIPRSPYGKAPPVGRAGDFLFLSSCLIGLLGGGLFGGWRLRRALIVVGSVLALAIANVALIVGLRLDEPTAYRATALTVIVIASILAVAVTLWALLRIRRAVEAAGSEVPTT